MPNITSERLREFTATLQKYKSGKASLERRVVSAENWWKLRNRFEQRRAGLGDDGGFQSASGWLHNVIVSKHADAMEAYPEPSILPREPGDREEARLLSAILPCILEQNRFEKTYADAMWQKLKTGTACYRVVWDPDRLGGLGDIRIDRVDLLNLFWEPGVRDIQDSRYLFCTHLEDEEDLVERYPQLRGRLRSSPFMATRFVYDDAVSTEGKATVIEVYYKKRAAGRTVLHYCKYVGDCVLEATEDVRRSQLPSASAVSEGAAKAADPQTPSSFSPNDPLALGSFGAPGEAQRSGFGQKRKTEGAKRSFPGSYGNPGNGAARASFDEGEGRIATASVRTGLAMTGDGEGRIATASVRTGLAMTGDAEERIATGASALAMTEDADAAPEAAVMGLYAHGRYPFVLDPLFPVEGSPCGYGFVDLCANVQTAIDLMRSAFVKNTLVGATPRYFQRIDGSVNEEEFVDLSRPLVHVSGNLGEDSLRQIGFAGLPGVYVNVLESTIRELRETSGNTETANGTMNVGVTAASAIAALQEASGKGSRDATRASYLAYAEIIELCIELIRQFYNLPRQFRIAGTLGADGFVSYSNAALLPRPQIGPGGLLLGMSQPVFDVKVAAQKRNAYSRLSQNELAMELYRLGLFEEGRELQALGCLELMEFDGKDALMGRIAAAAGLRDKLQELEKYRALALALAKRYRPDLAAGLLGEAEPAPPMGGTEPSVDGGAAGLPGEAPAAGDALLEAAAGQAAAAAMP